MLPTEDDPEGQQHGVEDSLPDVSKKQHPGPVEANREPLHWNVDKCHGDTQSKDYPEGAKTVLKLIMFHHYCQHLMVVELYNM